MINPRTGRRSAGDFPRLLRALLPLVRHRYRRRSAATDALRARDRDVHDLDRRAAADTGRGGVARQHRRRKVRARRRGRARRVTGEVLASVSYPWPARCRPLARGPAGGRRTTRTADDGVARSRALRTLSAGIDVQAGDRRRGAREPAVQAEHLHLPAPARRTRRQLRPRLDAVRCATTRWTPCRTATSDLDAGLVVSCNAYFAQLAQAARAAGRARGRVAVPDRCRRGRRRPQRCSGTLAHAGYGQGEVLVSPLKMARVSAAIAAGGRAVQPRWIAAAAGKVNAPPVDAPRFLSAEDAARLGKAMRDVVLDGTGRAVKANRVPIAGKTGTAEITGTAAHSWFTGFAPYGSSGPQIAFAVVVENAGYGAAPPRRWRASS